MQGVQEEDVLPVWEEHQVCVWTGRNMVGVVSVLATQRASLWEVSRHIRVLSELDLQDGET